jgi:TatD DNase family protein
MPDGPTLPALVDSHCHLTWESFDGDVDRVVGRMREAGVRQAVVVSIGVDNARETAALCRERDGLYPTAGIHPNDIPADADAALEALASLIDEGGFVAVGETGIDYYRDRVDRRVQQESFRRQAELARARDLALIVHVRDPEGSTDAHEDALHILQGVPGVRAVIHCFTGEAAWARRFAEAGYYVSFSGVVTFPKAENVREAARAVPVEQMLVETDAPFLAPVPHRGKRNEPAFVADVARALAPLKGLSESDLRRITARNARALFRLPTHETTGPPVYVIRDAAYVNVTNACDARCTFCPRTHDVYEVKGYDLRRPKDPTLEEILEALGDPSRYPEVVFCGFGEPTLRLETVKEVARAVKASGVRTRLNTNGHADLIHKRPVASELVGLIDVVSVSLNAQDRETFERHCPSAFSPDGFTPMLAWIRSAREAGLDVVCTALDGLEGVDVDACRRLAEELGARWRDRVLNAVG